MIIAYDYDDVIVDFVGAWLKSLNETKGTEYTREDIILKGWDMAEWATKVAGRHWLEQHLFDNMQYWVEAETEPGVVESMKRLNDAGHRLEIVTNKPAWARHVIYRWLQEHNPPIEKVIIANHFGKARLSDARVLLDDRPETLREWQDSGDNRVGVLYERSQNYHARNQFIHVPSHEEFERVIHILDRIERTGGRRRAV